MTEQASLSGRVPQHNNLHKQSLRSEHRTYVEIIEYQTGAVVKTIPCNSERQAEKVESGVNINLNHDLFYTRIKPGVDAA